MMFLLAGALFWAAGAAAQTSPATCALDSLYLLSPDRDGVEIRLVPEDDLAGTRLGVELRWPELADEISTCAVPVDTAGLDFTVYLEGDYLDEIDRSIGFVCINGGEAGSRDQNRVVWNWFNVQSHTGGILGEINVSNSGGFYRYDAGDDLWDQVNGGLPVYLPYTDLIVAASSPADPGLVYAQLASRENMRGLWRLAPEAETWERVGTEMFPDGSESVVGIDAIAMSHTDSDLAAFGTRRMGVVISRDGCESFETHTEDIAGGSWANRPITAVAFDPADDDCYVGIRNLGLYRSSDAGLSYDLLESMVVPNQWPDPESEVLPVINMIAFSGSTVYVALERYGLYSSSDDGATWTWVAQSLVSDVLEGYTTGLALAVDPADSDVILLGTGQSGLWRTADGGANWAQVATDFFDPEEAPPVFANVFFDSTIPGRVLAAAEGEMLLISDDGGVNWTEFADAPSIRNFGALASLGGGDFWMSTHSGGIYPVGTMIPMVSTINRSSTDPEYAQIDFGVSVGFGAGTIDPGDAFSLTLQDFQGYAVWRSDIGQEQDMQLIGLFDKNNPETCIVGYCGSQDFTIEPGCYAEKRSACFDFTEDGYVKFFDADIYDGFVYNYAVTSFDYGNTSTLSESGSNQTWDQLYSPRFNDDPISLFSLEDIEGDPSTIDGNLTQFAVNLENFYPGEPGDRLEIYPVPNPLREGVGFTENNGEMVEFRNLPPNSRIKVFTLDGDLVADLGSDLQEGHNMKWVTRNDDGRLLASGVYIWKAEMIEEDPVFGKLVIIR